MNKAADLIYSRIFAQTRYASRHVLSIPRVSGCFDLISAMGWLPGAGHIPGREATVQELERFHSPDYIQAVFRAEKDQYADDDMKRIYNIGCNGNPVYPGMYHRPATACGSGLLAAEQTRLSGAVFNPAGGTHHGRRGQASGFCYFNEPVITILAWLDQGLGRVLYVDLDAHHGDGVEEAFAADSRVLTLSVHEEKRWPGTGAVDDHAGGMACNLPVPAGLNDREFLLLLDSFLLTAGEAFAPQAVYIQCGVDALADDPQSRLALSNGAVWRAVASLSMLAPRVIVGGGGGYNPWSVSRAWAGVWAILSGLPIPDMLPEGASHFLGGLQWRHSRGRNPPDHWKTRIRDPENNGPVRPVISERIRQCLDGFSLC